MQIQTLCRWSLVLILLCAGQALAGGDEPAPSPSPAEEVFRLEQVTVSEGQQGTAFHLSGAGTPTYTVYELVDPLRLVIDLAQAELAAELALPKTYDAGPVAKITGAPIAENPGAVRVQFFLAEDRPYTVERQPNGLGVSFAGGAPASAAVARKLLGVTVEEGATGPVVHLRADGPLADYRYEELPPRKGKPARLYLDFAGVRLEGVPPVTEVGGLLARVRVGQRQEGVRVVLDSGRARLFRYTFQPAEDGMTIALSEPSDAAAVIAGLLAGDEQGEKKEAAAPAPAAASDQQQEAEAALPDTFGFAGYSGQRISVDFYKIDLHNVFRLIGEISGKNIVVDEGVGGSLTLALDNVPWDFVLDIILNLKGLQKEDRFNTIVISPKDKNFVWPKAATDAIAFKADPITIKKRITTSKTLVVAKQIVEAGRRLEAAGDRAGALARYEEAFKKWPENGALARRIAALALVDGRLNAKALHYAKQALKIDVSDGEAAMIAAVACANMGLDAEAKEYFDLAASGPRPASEVLVNYAAFLEEGGDYAGALAQLERNEDLHGDTLDTLVAKARLYDKNGEPAKAKIAYRAALYSGYPVPPDLAQYIRARLAADAQTQQTSNLHSEETKP